MDKVTKIMFGLIILAGVGGIVMALSVPGKIAKLRKAKDDADRLNGALTEDNKKIDDANKKLTGDLASEKTKYSALKKKYDTDTAGNAKIIRERDEAVAAKEKAVTAKEKAVRDLATLQDKYDKLLPQLNQLGKLKTENTRLKTEVARLEKIIKDLEDPPTPPSGPIAVHNVDSVSGYVMLTVSKEHTKKGDRYEILRDNQRIAKVVVADFDQGFTYCRVDPAGLVGAAQNPTTGDIQRGDQAKKLKQ